MDNSSNLNQIQISDRIPPEYRWSYSRFWEWFFRHTKYARLLIRDGFNKKLLESLDLDKLRYDDTVEPNAVGNLRITDLHLTAPLILTDQAIQENQKLLDQWSVSNFTMQADIYLSIIGEHKFGMTYSIYRQGFEMWAANIIKKFTMAREPGTGILHPLLSPTLILFFIHGPQHFPIVQNLRSLFLKTGNAFLDQARPSLKLFWFDLNRWPEKRFFTGTNPVEYDAVLKILQGTTRPNFGRTLKSTMDMLQPETNRLDVTECADKLLMLASTDNNTATPEEVKIITNGFHPLTGEDVMESKCIYDQLIDESERRGEIRGERRGELRGVADSTYDILICRFHDVPESTLQALLEIRDLPVLRSYRVFACQCQSLEEFNRRLFG